MAAPNVPAWLLGKNITAFVITGQTIAGDGSLTDAATTGVQPCAGIWEEIDIENQPNTEEISAADSTRTNNVLIQDASTMRMTTIMERVLRAGAGANDKANPLSWLVSHFDYLKVAFTRGGSTWSYIGLRGNYSESIRKGKCNATLSLLMIDPNQVNPSITP